MVCFVVQRLIVRVDQSAEAGAQEDAQEGECGGDGGPATEFAEDDGDAAELHVENAVTKTVRLVRRVYKVIIIMVRI